jgi:hypothetical protein
MGLLDQMTKEGVAPNSLTFAAVIKVRAYLLDVLLSLHLCC